MIARDKGAESVNCGGVDGNDIHTVRAPNGSDAPRLPSWPDGHALEKGKPLFTSR
jgi:hypothetical protein